MPRFTNPHVGVGADDDSNIFQQIGQRFFEDEDARKRREVLEDAARAQQFQQQGMPSAQAEARVQQERQFTPDPLRWVQERAEDTRRNPIIGGLRSLGALPEAAGTAARYATGVALAPAQAGAQAYGWNPGAALQQTATDSANLPGSDLPVFGGIERGLYTAGGTAAGALGTMANTGANLLTGNTPRQRGDLAGQSVWDMSPTPVPNWENPFDPREALQRSRALAGPGEVAPELVAGGAAFGPMGRGLSRLGGEAAGGLAPDVGVLGSVHGNPVADFFAPGRGALGATIPPVAGAVAGAIAPIIPGKPADEETTITDRLMGAGEGFLLGGLLGMGASPLERRLITRASPPGRPAITGDVDAWLRSQPGGNTVADSLLPELFQSNARVQGYEGRAVTPGGPMQNAIDGLVTALHDPLARVGTLMSWADQEMADRLRMAKIPVPQGQSVLGDAGNAFINLSNSRSIRQRMQPLIADMQQDIRAKGGAIYDNENDWFNVLATMEMMATASQLQQPKFMGSYLKLKQAMVPGFGTATAEAMTQAELLADRDLVRGAIQRAFPDRIDQWDPSGKQVAYGVLSRMDATRSGLAELSNKAMDALADGGVLDQNLVNTLKGRFGDQYVYLQAASTHYTEIRPKANAGPDYLASTRLIGSLHNDQELPAFTIGGQLQRVQNAIALAEHNKGMNNLADTMYMLGDFRTDPKTGADISLGVPGLIEPNGKVAKPVPGPATYERIKRDPSGAPVLDANGQPVMETVTRPGVTNMAMVYADNVDKDMGILPYFSQGEYRELLGERSLVETLNGANLETQNAATKLVAEQAKFFARGVTSLSPFFSLMHGLRQFQEFVEKAPSGELGRSMSAYFAGMYATFTGPLADFAATHPQNPIVAGLPGQMAAALDRGFGGDPKRALVDLFHKEGGGGATLPAQLSRTQSALEMIGGQSAPDWKGKLRQEPLGWLTNPIKNLYDANQAVTGLFDELPRLATFDVALQQGARQGLTQAEALPGALYKARTFTNDYSRMGTSMVVLNSIFPLLNARKEGFLTSLGGALEDPQKFATRMSFWIGLPAVTTYAANRLTYGDAYDDIPVEEKDMYFHVPYGWWQDEYGRDHPLTLKVVKSPFIQAITAPIEQLLDSQYHLAKDQEYLAENQRTSRPDARMWLTSLARMTPLEGQPDMAADVKHLAFAAASMQPLVSMAVEMASNEDHFTGRDIIPPDKRLIPPQYQYGVGTSMTAKLAGKYLHQSPGVIDQFAADMFGTAGRSAMHVPDLITGILQKHGLMDQGGDPFAPQTAADLPNLAGLPPEVVNRYLDQMQHEDMRPWQGQFLPRFFGTAYSGRSIQERAKQLGPDEKERWETTLEYNRRSQEIKIKYSGLRADLENQAPDITNAAYRDKLWQLTMQEKGARKELADTYAGRAWTSPAERQAAINAMPGTSADSFQKSLAQLPPGTDVAALANQWEAIGQQGNAPTVASMRNKWLQQTSQQLHVSASTILDYLGSYHLGNELVGLPAPTEDLERLRIEHAAPMDPKDPTKQLDPFTTPPDKFRAAQRAVVANYASMWGVPEGNLLERLNARYHLPGETVGTTQAQAQLASMVETRFHNPAEYPRYSSPTGLAVGTPDDWEVWDQQLDDARNKYGDQRNRWPGGIRVLDDARRYGNAHRYMDMYRHAVDGEPAEREAALAQLVAWERFYGTGRNATLNEWQSFMSNGQTKYKADITPQTALAWDAMYQTYRLMPPGPEQNRLRPFAERIRRAMNTRWQRIIDERDAVGSELQQT